SGVMRRGPSALSWRRQQLLNGRADLADLDLLHANIVLARFHEGGAIARRAGDAMIQNAHRAPAGHGRRLLEDSRSPKRHQRSAERCGPVGRSRVDGDVQIEPTDEARESQEGEFPGLLQTGEAWAASAAGSQRAGL